MTNLCTIGEIGSLVNTHAEGRLYQIHIIVQFTKMQSEQKFSGLWWPDIIKKLCPDDGRLVTVLWTHSPNCCIDFTHAQSFSFRSKPFKSHLKSWIFHELFYHNLVPRWIRWACAEWDSCWFTALLRHGCGFYRPASGRCRLYHGCWERKFCRAVHPALETGEQYFVL